MNNQPIDLDSPITITTIKRYTQFYIKKIDIPFGEDAQVHVCILDIPNSNYLYETITIPIDLYSSWKYDEEQIIDFCKNYIQDMFADGGIY